MIMLAYILASAFALFAIASNDIYYLMLSLLACAIAIIHGKD
jgi:hypothetical protein